MIKILDSHIKEAEKISESIFQRPPIEQQEMLTAIKKRVYLLNKMHLEKISE